MNTSSELKEPLNQSFTAECSVSAQQPPPLAMEQIYPILNVTDQFDKVQWLKRHVEPIKNSDVELIALVNAEMELNLAVEHVNWIVEWRQWNLFIPNVSNSKFSTQKAPCRAHNACYQSACYARHEPLIVTHGEFVIRLLEFLIRHRSIHVFEQNLLWQCQCDKKHWQEQLTEMEYNVTKLCWAMSRTPKVCQLLPCLARVYPEEMKKSVFHLSWITFCQVSVEQKCLDALVLELLQLDIVRPTDTILQRTVGEHLLHQSFEYLVSRNTTFVCCNKTGAKMDFKLFAPVQFLIQPSSTVDEQKLITATMSDTKYPLTRDELMQCVRACFKRQYFRLLESILCNSDSLQVIFREDVLIALQIIRSNPGNLVPLFVQELATLRLTMIKECKEVEFDQRMFQLLKILILEKDDALLIKALITEQLPIRRQHVLELLTDYVQCTEIRIILQCKLTEMNQYVQ